MIETVIAVVVITFMFLGVFRLSRLLTTKILMQHAAMRVARARTVGLNRFMCLKSARVAVIPVAGRRIWPTSEGDENFDYDMERARSAIYMGTPNPAIARGVLEYAGWNRLSVDEGDGTDSRVTMNCRYFGEGEDGRPAESESGNDWFTIGGKAGVEQNYTLYMMDGGR